MGNDLGKLQVAAPLLPTPATYGVVDDEENAEAIILVAEITASQLRGQRVL